MGDTLQSEETPTGVVGVEHIWKANINSLKLCVNELH